MALWRLSQTLCIFLVPAVVLDTDYFTPWKPSLHLMTQSCDPPMSLMAPKSIPMRLTLAIAVLKTESYSEVQIFIHQTYKYIFTKSCSKFITSEF